MAANVFNVTATAVVAFLMELTSGISTIAVRDVKSFGRCVNNNCLLNNSLAF